MADEQYIAKLQELQAGFEQRYQNISHDPAAIERLGANYERARAKIEAAFAPKPTEEDTDSKIMAVARGLSEAPSGAWEAAKAIPGMVGGIVSETAKDPLTYSGLWGPMASLTRQYAKRAANQPPQRTLAEVSGAGIAALSPIVAPALIPMINSVSERGIDINNGTPRSEEEYLQNMSKDFGVNALMGWGPQAAGGLTNRVLTTADKLGKMAMPNRVASPMEMTPELQAALRLAEAEKRIESPRGASDIIQSGEIRPGELNGANIIQGRAQQPGIMGNTFDTPASLGGRELIEGRNLREVAPDAMSSDFFSAGSASSYDVLQLGTPIKERAPIGKFTTTGPADDSLLAIEKRSAKALEEAHSAREYVTGTLDKARDAMESAGMPIVKIRAEELDPYLLSLDETVKGLKLSPSLTGEEAAKMSEVVGDLRQSIKDLRFNRGNPAGATSGATITEAQRLISNIYRVERRFRKHDESIQVQQANGQASALTDHGAQLEALAALKGGLQDVIKAKTAVIVKEAQRFGDLKALPRDVLKFSDDMVSRTNRAYETWSRAKDSFEKMTDITDAGGSRRSGLNLKTEATGSDAVTPGTIRGGVMSVLADYGAKAINRARGINPEAQARNMAEADRLRRLTETGKDMRDYITVANQKTPFKVSSPPREAGYITTLKTVDEFTEAYARRTLQAGAISERERIKFDRTPAVNLGRLEAGLTLKFLRDNNVIDDAKFRSGVLLEEVDPQSMGMAQQWAISMLQPLVEAVKNQDEQLYGSTLSGVMSMAPELFAPSRSGLPGEIMISKGVGKVYLPNDVVELNRRIDASDLPATTKAARKAELNKTGRVLY